MALRTPFANDAKTYGFEWLRGMLEAGLQQGVLNMGGAGTDLKATVQTGTLRLDVAAGAALVKGTSGVAALGLSQGLFMVINDAAITTAVTLASGHATLPRIDQICLKVEDSSDLGSGADQVTVVAVAGTATSGATLDNRNGAAALPANHFLLADQLVPAAASSLLAANTRDRRAWARGAYRRILRNANAAAGSNYTTTSTSAVAIDGTNLSPRIECSGVPVRVTLRGTTIYTATGGRVRYQHRVDGATIDGTLETAIPIVSAGDPHGTNIQWDLVPAAGSHVFAPYWRVDAANTGTLQANASDPAELVIEELVRQNVDNT